MILVGCAGAVLALCAPRMTSRPHDALFKSAFEAPADAAMLLRDLLPASICDAIAWHTFTGESGSYVDAVLGDRHSDLLFSARLRIGDGARIFVALEHQSTVHPVMALRTLTYQTQVWNRLRKQRREDRPSPILGVVVSHVPDGWTGARSFEDLFDPAVLAIPGLAGLVPRFSLLVEDLAHRSNDELKRRSVGTFQKLALWLLRDGRDAFGLVANFDAWIPELRDIERASGSDSFATLITYIFRVADPVIHDHLRAKIHQIGARAEETAMTIAQMLRREGRREGHREGRREGHREGREDALRTQLLFKFKLQALEEQDEARLRRAAPEELDRYLKRVLMAESVAAVFDD